MNLLKLNEGIDFYHNNNTPQFNHLNVRFTATCHNGDGKNKHFMKWFSSLSIKNDIRTIVDFSQYLDYRKINFFKYYSNHSLAKFQNKIYIHDQHVGLELPHRIHIDKWFIGICKFK